MWLNGVTGKNGYLWYGESAGGGPDDWADMGRTGAVGIAFFASPYREGTYLEQARRYSDIIGKHPQSFPDTHGTPPMGMAYEALAAHIEPKDFRQLMDANRWGFTRSWCTAPRNSSAIMPMLSEAWLAVPSL